MSLQNIKKLQAERGFTIVELLIVIVVIGILAAIVIVAYNGVQNSAKTQSSKATAANVQKKIEAYNATASGYPDEATYANFTTELNSETTSTLQGTGITLGTPNNTTTNRAGIWKCDASPTTYSITWYDYTSSAVVTAADGLKINFTSCAAWTELT